MATITVRERSEPVTAARPDAEGVWRSEPTGAMRTMYDVLIDQDRYATTPDRAAALRIAEERAFFAGLAAGDPAAAGALALYLTREEG